MKERTLDADHWIKRLDLAPHPEGGYYREIYRAGQRVEAIPRGTGTPQLRTAATSIYYLLRVGQSSCLHRLKSDEIWHFLDGRPIEVRELEPESIRRTVLGRSDAADRDLHRVVPRNTWFGATPEPTGDADFSLVACTVAPGFEFEDFEMATEEQIQGLCTPAMFEEMRDLVRQA